MAAAIDFLIGTSLTSRLELSRPECEAGGLLRFNGRLDWESLRGIPGVFGAATDFPPSRGERLDAHSERATRVGPSEKLIVSSGIRKFVRVGSTHVIGIIRG
jgi:hypothetical protein